MSSPDRSRLFSFCCSSPTARGCCSGLQRKPPWSWRRAPRCRAERTKPSSPWSGSSRTPRGISPPGRWAPCHSELSPPQRSQSSWAPVWGSSPWFFFPLSLSHSLSLPLFLSFSPLSVPLCVTAVAAPTVSCATPSFRVPPLVSPACRRPLTLWDSLTGSRNVPYPSETCTQKRKKKKERKENQNPLKKIQRGDLRLLSARLIFRHTSFKTLKSHTSRTCGVFEGKRFQSSGRWIVHSPQCHSEQRVWQQMFPQWWCCVCVRAPASTLRTHRSYN